MFRSVGFGAPARRPRVRASARLEQQRLDEHRMAADATSATDGAAIRLPTVSTAIRARI